MKSGKTILLSILLFAAILPLVLSAIFLGGRIVIRITMLQSLGEEKVSVIRIPEREFKWYEENREIVVDGKMFDVKTIALIDGVYEITGLYDEMETQLNAMLEDIHKDAGNNHDNSISLYHVCLGLIAEQPFPEQINLAKLSPEKIFHSHYSCDLLDISYRLISPPPESALI